MARGAQRRSTISARQRAVLEGLSRRHGTGQQVALRARLVLATAEQPGTVVAAAYGVDRDTVGLWRARWAVAQERLTALEDAPDMPEREVRAAVEAVLHDAPRPGTPPTFSAVQVIGIVKLACTLPEEADCPCSQWSARELADAAIRQGIVACISPRTVGRFLKGCIGQGHVAHNWRRHRRVDARRDSGIRVGSSRVICVGLVRHLCNMSLPNTRFLKGGRLAAAPQRLLADAAGGAGDL